MPFLHPSAVKVFSVSHPCAPLASTMSAPMTCSDNYREPGSSTLPSQLEDQLEQRRAGSYVESTDKRETSKPEQQQNDKDDPSFSSVEENAEVDSPSNSSLQTDEHEGEGRYATRSVKKTASKRRSGSLRLSDHAVSLLRGWVFSPEHIDYPYPSKAEKEELAQEAGITIQQLNNFMANIRKRSWGPFWKRKKGMDTGGKSEYQKPASTNDLQQQNMHGGKRLRSFPSQANQEESISQADGALMLSRLKRIKGYPENDISYVSGPSRPLRVPTMSSFYDTSQYQGDGRFHGYNHPSTGVNTAYLSQATTAGNYPVQPRVSTTTQLRQPWPHYWPPTSGSPPWPQYAATAPNTTAPYYNNYPTTARPYASQSAHPLTPVPQPSYGYLATSTFPPPAVMAPSGRVHGYQHTPHHQPQGSSTMYRG
eukprot:gb/GECG01005869.1/.p1 GENE.gb/GECG01005869.1/~~gb/GECG01005869.1/.p1  ORF type:complete len:423 (+),score=43.93 gb/GECG01005869.1/:1-1269(+)